MYILNAFDLKTSVEIPVKVGKYMEKKLNVFAVLKQKDCYYFTNTEKFQNASKKLPFWLKI